MLDVLVFAVALSGPVPAAIERSVQERMGDVRVQVSEIDGATVRGGEGPKVLVAQPEPGSRLGRPVRFVLTSGGVRVGSVIAKLGVTGSALRASRALLRGEDLDAGAIEVVDTELKGMLLGRIPTMSEVAGAQARRDIKVGEILTDSAVIVPPAVKSGDEVRVTVSAGVIQVTGVGRASGSGRVGDVIRVLVPSSRRGLSARITGPGSVEIVR
jgi:flagella basal body P-ring formation protein FlgA